MHDIYDKFGPNICLLPFVGAFISTFSKHSNSAELRPCCHASIHTEIKGSLIGSYNGEHYKSLRKDHAEGQGLQNLDCAVCLRSEMATGSSGRKLANEHLVRNIDIDWSAMIDSIVRDDYTVNVLPVLDIMPSNYCNLACIMCGGHASTTRESIEAALNGRPPNFGSISEYPADIYDVMQNVMLLNFTGGETTIQPEFKRLVKHLCDVGDNSHIKIGVLTNLTNYDQELYKLLDSFDECYLTVSIDGIGKHFEYQRRNASWDKVEANLRNLRELHPDIRIFINYVVTAVSALSLPDFLSWALDRGEQDIGFTMVRDAPHLEISALTDKEISFIRERIKNILDSSMTGLADFRTCAQQALGLIGNHIHDPDSRVRLIDKMAAEDNLWKRMTLKDVMGISLDG